MTVMCDGRQVLTMGQAARELELRTGEFELATQLGEVRTIPAGPPGRRRVPAEEIDRLRAEPGFPDALRERVRTVGTTEAAELMGIGPGRFLRLTRAGCLGPVRFYPNRYGAVVWLYLATEITGFADREPGLMRGSIPAAMRVMLAGGQDWRGRQWRGRRVAQLMGQAEDRWEPAAVIAAVLPPEELASVVDDPRERSLLRELRPPFASVITATAAARESFDRVLTAEEFDEVMWYRVNLSRALATARRDAPARPRQATSARRRPPGFANRPSRTGTYGSVTELSRGRKSPSWTTETSSLPSRS
ncbi:DUF6397 family protein [Streptomyces celluloflavus]|uniref:DUF6397 family protein n=1 Tax=Streptomyces celluloflavus TaxID=58344 RepID=UPI0036ADE1EE